MRKDTWRRRSALIIGTAVGIVGIGAAPAVADHGRGHDGDHHHSPSAFTSRVLISDQAGTGAALTDPNLVNPWGIAFGPTTPLWTANNGTSTSTLYRSLPAPATVPLVVDTEPAPTGIVFNSTTSDFALPDGTHPNFLFDSLSGQISAWAPGTTHTTPIVTIPGAHFTGLSLSQSDHGALLFAADASSPVVDVFNGSWDLVNVLRDDHLPNGLTPYNVAAIGNRVYVSYAPPPGVTSSVKGAVDVYDLDGRLRDRLIKGGVLDEPWGMVIAPNNWGGFGGALLVGNESGGRINAFDPHNGHFLGTLEDAHGKQIGADGLWGMQFGNGVIGTPNDLVIAIGTDGYQHGVVELVAPLPSKHGHG